jgi:hypothetical protein
VLSAELDRPGDKDGRRDGKGGFSAADFGAAGDGRTDDTAALQAALDATFKNGRQGFLTIPPGTYRVTRTLAIAFQQRGRDNVTRLSGISARGAQIVSNIRDEQPVLRIVSRAVVRFLLIEGLNIQGRGYESHGIEIDVEGEGRYLYNACLRDVVVQGCGGDGFRVIGNAFESQVINCYFRDNKGNGTTLGHGRTGGVLSAYHFMGCVFGGNGQHGVSIINRASDVSFHCCYFLLNGRFGLAAENGVSLLSHCGFENNQEKAGSFADGDAGIDLRTSGVLIGCTSYSIRRQTHMIRAYIANRLVMVGCTGSGGGDAKGAKLARLQGNGNAEATMIGCRGGIDVERGIELVEFGQRGAGASFGSRWDSRSLPRLGEYRLWVDDNGKLRIKRGDPKSADDGAIVGATS